MVRNVVFVIIFCMLITLPAVADIITSPSDPALSGATVIDFDSQTPGTYTSLTIGHVGFTAIDNHFRITSDYIGQYNNTGVFSLDNGTYSDMGFSSLLMTFDTAVNAFGFNWGASNTPPWVLSAYDASNNLLENYNLPITGASNSGDFVGLAVNGIDHALLSGTLGDWVFVDNFTYAYENNVVVPVPGAVLLGILGLGAAGFKLRRFA